MSDLPPEWDTFAAAWLAKTVVAPPPHGETAESYAAKQCETAATVADRMLLLRGNAREPPDARAKGGYPADPPAPARSPRRRGKPGATTLGIRPRGPTLLAGVQREKARPGRGLRRQLRRERRLHLL